MLIFNKWPRICFTCRKHFPVLSSFMTYHLVCNTTGPFWSSYLVVCGVRVTRSLVLCIMFCLSLFVLFVFAIVWSVLLRFTDSDYLFGIFKLFINYQIKRKHSATKILTMMYTSYGKVVYEKKKCFKSFPQLYIWAANCSTFWIWYIFRDLHGQPTVSWEYLYQKELINLISKWHIQ